MPLDRIVLIECLALAILVNAAAIIVALRARSRSVAASSDETSGPDISPPRTTFAEVVVTKDVAASTAPRVAGGDGSPRLHAGSSAQAAHHPRGRRSVRSITVLSVLVDDLDDVARAGGLDAVGWLCGMVERCLRASAREADRVHGDGIRVGAFRVLLLDSDAAGADAYLGRVLRTLGGWLDGRGTVARVTAGWATTSSDVDLAVAERLASARSRGAADGWLRSSAALRSTASASASRDSADGFAHQAFPDGVAYEGGRPSSPELVGQVRDVATDGVRADPQATTDLRRT
jgi:hypothetical protein